MSIILGIDPGTTTTGFAIIKKEGKNIEILNYGVIETKALTNISEKIRIIGNDIENLIKEYKPDICGIEKLFFLKNLKTGIDVAQARGTMLYILATHGIPVLEYTPLQVKSGICGSGSALKKQVQNALKIIYKLDSIPTPDDAADALAIAYITSLSRSLI
ncbi:crossover junction endodeoxyribonuclease RuvC [Candidatus Gracilibacteria bacterium]|nr:crossover junction endodeoxyribonuclease RuvC [Candidatus Gracilibacteria bacterium]